MLRVDVSLESTLNNSDSFIPDGIETKPNLSTGAAWNNFDINLETPSGADTIHGTHGICYQTIKETDETETEESSEIHVNLNQPPNRLLQSQKRENYQDSVKLHSPKLRNLNPIGKKNSPSNLVFSSNKVRPSVSYLNYSNIDTLWITAAILFSKPPMWVGTHNDTLNLSKGK